MRAVTPSMLRTAWSSRSQPGPARAVRTGMAVSTCTFFINAPDTDPDRPTESKLGGDHRD